MEGCNGLNTLSKPSKQKLTLIGSVTSLDGSEEFKDSAFGYIDTSDTLSQQISHAEAIGIMLARKLEEVGVYRVLDEIKKDRENKESVNTAPGRTS